MAEVSRAWFDLTTAHESLRSTYDLTGSGPVQQVHTVHARLLETVELERRSFDNGGVLERPIHDPS